MEQEPNKYDSFFRETSAKAADEELAYRKLLAIKKKMAQSKVLATKVGAFQAPTTLAVTTATKGNQSTSTTNRQATKNKPEKSTSSTNKKVSVENVKAPIQKTAKKVVTKKNKALIKPSTEPQTGKQAFGVSKKRPNFSTKPLPKTIKEPINKSISKNNTTTPTPKETLKRPAIPYRKRPNFVTNKTPIVSKKIATKETKSGTNTATPIPNKKSPVKPFNAATLRDDFLTSKITPPSISQPASQSKTAENKPQKIVATSSQNTSKKETPFSIDKNTVATTKQANTSTKKPPISTETMQPIDNHASSTTYGRGQGVHVSDSPYTEKPIPIDGKNLVPRSQEVHDILSYVPNWMIRWGNTVILLIIGGILVMSYYIKYPDVVQGMISINSTSPPVTLVAKASGALTLLKADKEIVTEGELIGILKSTADYQDVLVVKEELSTFQEKLEKGWNFSYYELPTGLQLGDLQGAYSNLFIKLKEKKIQHQSTKNDQTRKQHINQQLTELEAIKKAKEKSLSIKYQEYLKAKSILDTRYKVLYEKGSISAEQMNAKESEVRNLLDMYQNDRMSLNEIKKRILDQNSNKVELDFQKADQSVLSASSLFTAYESLKNSLHTWEETYLLKAPVAGKLNFIQFTKDNMYLQQEQVIANIVPMINETDTNPTMIGELLMPTLGAGKAAIGQTVNVALNDYPKKQYGIIEGKVASIADVSTVIPGGEGMTAYKVVVSFPKGLENTMKKEMQFKHNMQGRAEIITEDVRLIERFFHELRGLFDAK